MIGAARYFHCAECSQVIGHKLGIEQAVVTGPQPGHEMHQRDLRSIARAVEHALAEKNAAKAHTIQAANQLIVFVDFDGVAVAALVVEHILPGGGQGDYLV